MIALIETQLPEIAVLCDRFGVQSLEVFGSAASGAFDPAHSDIDFLVEFSPDDAGSLFHRYFPSLFRTAGNAGKNVAPQDRPGVGKCVAQPLLY